MDALVSSFLAAHPSFRLRALGARANRDALDLAPFGHAVEYLDAAEHPAWVDRYHAANKASFPGFLALPGWVLVDLFLMPAAIGLLTCPARLCDVRPPGLADDDEAVAAAYYAAPSVRPGAVIGVSLISLREGIGAAGLIKAVTLRMHRATEQVGIAQWGNRSVRVHTRMGALRLVGPVPGAHDKAGESFIYSVDLRDPEAIAASMARAPDAPDPEAPPGASWIPVADLAALADLLRRAVDGEAIAILPPGLSRDGLRVLVARSGITAPAASR